MALHFEGYTKAVEAVHSMADAELYEQIDALEGRGNLPDDPTHEDLLYEALRQTDWEFTDRSSAEYENVKLWKDVVKASRQ